MTVYIQSTYISQCVGVWVCGCVGVWVGGSVCVLDVEIRNILHKYMFSNFGNAKNMQYIIQDKLYKILQYDITILTMKE